MKTKNYIAIVTAIVAIAYVNLRKPEGARTIANSDDEISLEKLVSKDDQEKTIEPTIKVNDRKQHHHLGHDHAHAHEDKDPGVLTAVDNDMYVFSDSEIGNTFLEIHEKLNATDANHDEEVNELLDKLRKNPKEAVSELTDAYDRLDDSALNTKYDIVYMAEELQVVEAIPFLKDILLDPVKKDIPKYEGHGSVDQLGQHAMIKMRAIGGLDKLASVDPSVREVLFESIIKAENVTLLRDSIYAYLNTSTDIETDKLRVKNSIAPDYSYLVSLEVDDASDLVPPSEEDAMTNNTNAINSSP